MNPARRFEFQYDRGVFDQLRALDPKARAIVRDALDEQLRHEPDVPTRNREPLRRPGYFELGTWRIRFGPDNRFRVFYRTDREARIVRILALGIKRGNRLFIGDEEIRGESDP